jgi:hypothetical protein
MKIYDGMYKFLCDKCFDIAGIADIESIALEMARKTAITYGWKWEHPHWGLVCNRCLQYEKENKTL